MNKNLKILLLLLLAPVLAVTTVFASEKVGDVIHVFSTSDECIIGDPLLNESVIIKHEDVQFNDEITIRRFITNRCDNTIDVGIALDRPSGPSFNWISIESRDEGTFSFTPGQTRTHLATVIFGNDTPANVDVEVRWKVSRPE